MEVRRRRTGGFPRPFNIAAACLTLPRDSLAVLMVPTATFPQTLALEIKLSSERPLQMLNLSIAQSFIYSYSFNWSKQALLEVIGVLKDVFMIPLAA
ncbi:hypothetical protein E2C01_016562 [Portunus trituberculatus]|uniref:Uncharacterized protein n=1 Tax=Portunus trituberculatus TaxID=210409 RepID=A0A5B7DPD3_PORTR|nr:hypothetical protein [Portunus trituberculatus]